MRTLLLAVGLLAMLPAASACDVCGCSIGGNYFGILPQFHRNFAGFRWAQQSFRSAHLPADARHGRFDSEEHFQTADLLAPFAGAQFPYPFYQDLGKDNIQANARWRTTAISFFKHSFSHTI
ncbi:MAG: hypothetical protein SFV22_11725 [Saprospiraceae bacterium]|nr:hypothetical protein [Saprospiraceae bacterium]